LFGPFCESLSNPNTHQEIAHTGQNGIVHSGDSYTPRLSASQCQWMLSFDASGRNTAKIVDRMSRIVLPNELELLKPFSYSNAGYGHRVLALIQDDYVL
jgi:hypothetical protein